MIGPNTTHVTLLERVAKADDHAAWTEFCERYGPLIRSFARRRHVRSGEIDDIMQDVLMILSKSMQDFEYDPSKGKFRSYLKTLVIRAVYRKTFQKKSPVLLEDIDAAIDPVKDDPETEAIWEEEWRQHHVRQAMRIIAIEYNEQDQNAFEYYAVQGRSAQETADELGINVDQVYKAKSRILKRLSELIRQQVDEEG
ncbi:MAG TPA: sigma-70 family RNA polymerase sigma factor [Phycisphaerae bacterium]|nr:sigma-70 family RNA polymerase sigma factor [Phycisphaerae bacterium]